MKIDTFRSGLKDSLKTIYKSLLSKSVLSSVFWFSLLGFLRSAINILLLSISQILNYYLFDRIVRLQTEAPTIVYNAALMRIIISLSVVIISFTIILPYSISLYGLIQFLIVLTIMLSLDGNQIFKLTESKL